MIKIKDLSLEYPEGFSLVIDKLTIEEGDILGIIGPNGAGKTTLLNIIAMLEKPGTGDIEIFGKDISSRANKPALRRAVSFVFSQPYLLNRNVYENVCLPLKLRGIRDESSVENMLETFKINHLRERNALLLSQGEKHRVVLARAFVAKPKLLLLDEPFLSLDRRYKETLSAQLRRIIKLNKVTAIFVSQEQDEVLGMADKICVMKEGMILQQGRPADVFIKPASREVADFVGVETILEGEIVKKEDNLCFIKVGDKVLEAVSECEADEGVFVCIRPEDVVISQQLDLTSARNHFKAKITGIEPWGLSYKLSLDCAFNLVASVTRQSIESLDLKAGKEIVASFKATAIHLIKR